MIKDERRVGERDEFHKDKAISQMQATQITIEFKKKTKHRQKTRRDREKLRKYMCLNKRERERKRKAHITRRMLSLSFVLKSNTTTQT